MGAHTGHMRLSRDLARGREGLLSLSKSVIGMLPCTTAAMCRAGDGERSGHWLWGQLHLPPCWVLLCTGAAWLTAV